MQILIALIFLLQATKKNKEFEGEAVVKENWMTRFPSVSLVSGTKSFEEFNIIFECMFVKEKVTSVIASQLIVIMLIDSQLI